MSRRVAAGEFKARCLALLDEVAETHETIVVTKRGRPVARLVPVEKAPARALAGSARFVGDPLAPVAAEWDVDR